MLQIRQAQVAAFQAARDRPLIEFIIRQLRIEHAAALTAVETHDLAAQVEAGIARARKHGFTASEHLFRFVDALFRYGDDFDRDLDSALQPAARLEAAIAIATRKR
jgi:hypothetical protein